MLWEEKGRKPIPMKVKRRVYGRAKGKCEKCGTRLAITEGDFHHTKDPTVTPRSSSVRFLCPLCHRRYGHKMRTTRRELLFGTETKVRVVRKDVVKIRSKRKPKTRRVAIRGIFGNIIGYRTVRLRKPKKASALKRISRKRRRTTRKRKA